MKKSRVPAGRSDLMFDTALSILTLRVLTGDPLIHAARLRCRFRTARRATVAQSRRRRQHLEPSLEARVLDLAGEDPCRVGR
jgi:hypothetical protein